MNATTRWWDYLDEPKRWVVRCAADGDALVNQPTADTCPTCGDPVLRMGRYRAEAPGTLYASSTICRECGDDLLTQPGLLQRCRDLHKPNQKATA